MKRRLIAQDVDSRSRPRPEKEKEEEKARKEVRNLTTIYGSAVAHAPSATCAQVNASRRDQWLPPEEIGRQ